VKNSWDEDWGDDGYFKYAITQNSDGPNAACGLGVGVEIRDPNTGDVQMGFGAVKFDIETRSGAPVGTVFKSLSGGSGDKFWYIIGGILLAVVIAYVVYQWKRK